MVIISLVNHHIVIFSKLIETYFDKKNPWNFLNSSMELWNNIWTIVVPMNSMQLKQHNIKFHGIPWNFIQTQSSMEFYETFPILPSSMEFRGTLILKDHIRYYCVWYLIDDYVLFGQNLPEMQYITLISIS